MKIEKMGEAIEVRERIFVLCRIARKLLKRNTGISLKPQAID